MFLLSHVTLLLSHNTADPEFSVSIIALVLAIVGTCVIYWAVSQTVLCAIMSFPYVHMYYSVCMCACVCVCACVHVCVCVGGGGGGVCYAIGMSVVCELISSGFLQAYHNSLCCTGYLCVLLAVCMLYWVFVCAVGCLYVVLGICVCCWLSVCCTGYSCVMLAVCMLYWVFVCAVGCLYVVLGIRV